ncbi:MAG: HisA/HisF-related TIM barrel protein [Acidimicrobiaceae bacterium]|nr:HisA/HisF-related TIM barrel protein [Acidimicrobiaceae bacterium]MCY4176389.1 HisA/HisF-related TIM barrel protein [Acidimicrobiaceae bacterium]MCY4280614.1 HisA/HisF-related TIM barrel protein [Acidimicrobiaceae bacterium]MCY4294630.1 HisA/HisF-related TIM barrel protein [Acidimicrobiaceae bacterium]
MDLYCAVDIRGGRCVRLRQGDYGAETVYDDDPVAQAVSHARSLARAGSGWIHVVDLDGARSGQPENAALVAEIAAAADMPVQAGGGVRSLAAAEAWFDAGVTRVVLGTAALRQPELVRELAGSRRVAVGLDGRCGELASDGWLEGSGRSASEVARSFCAAGVDAFVVTEISRDGTLEGPDSHGLASLLDAVADEAAASNSTAPAVIASGGVGTLADLRALAALRGRGGDRLSGVIVGTALYEKRFSVSEAVASLRAGRTGG